MQSRFPDLKGKEQNLALWKGRVLVVNFWATWCPPCRAEIPALIDDQEKYGAQGLQFVGIAVDRAEDIREFAKEYGINFPVLHGEAEGMELAASLGNSAYALPYTVVIDRTGKITGTAIGFMGDDRFNALVRPLL
ncbi:alkyl hydroperoxide reductase [Pandoraea terrae]|uniref:Alkyl hydroperoxide reductase n=1 Tax=Pandoraea terrae TaxID=1537710 RepID=A0A5E4VA49_9BURK|nr:TlpA disulfide reductase family protein [Pandoraea terrae]VVE09016.1 alkyl hydroperoxide reductase [Pandoraea terrae]